MFADARLAPAWVADCAAAAADAAAAFSEASAAALELATDSTLVGVVPVPLKKLDFAIVN